MGLFGDFLKLTTDIVASPLAIAKDVVTLSGTLIDEESATSQLLEKIGEDINKIIANED